MKRNLSPKIARLFAALLAITAMASLTACAGGEGATNSPTETKEQASGAITGFGSVIVEGQRYEDDGAVVRNEIDSTALSDASLEDLKLGMQVELDATDGKARSVVIHAELIATIESLTSDGFVAAGQAVVVSADTVFDGAALLSQLMVGDYVEVHGQRDDAGSIVATRVERKDPDRNRGYRIVGAVSAVNAQSQTFQIANLTIVWNDTTRIVPGVSNLIDGASVAVYGVTAPQAGTLLARAIRVRGDDTDRPLNIRTGGLIRNLNFAEKTFNIRRLRVDSSRASYVHGTEHDLANGRWVRVRGVWQAAEDGARIIKAREVHYRRDFDADTSVLGPISNFVSAASFMVRGVPVDASAGEVVFKDGTVDNLANGVIVKIAGSVKGNALVAAQVEFVSTALEQRRSVAGLVRDYNAQAGSFFLHGIGMQLTPDTIYLHGDGTPASVGELNTGDAVFATGKAVSGVFEVTRLVMRRGPSIVVDKIDGAIYNVDVTTGRFHLNGTVIRWDDTTLFTGNGENMRNGARAEIRIEMVDGQIVARQISIHSPDNE